MYFIIRGVNGMKRRMMRTPYNRFAIIPFHCTDCHNYIWLERYRYASVWDFRFDRSISRKICKKCIKKYDVKDIGE